MRNTNFSRYSRQYDLGIKPRIFIGKDLVRVKLGLKILKFRYKSDSDLENLLQLLERNYVLKTYSSLDVESETVVDIGANVGDTAIYFAASGAKHVYAVEPYPYTFRLAKENIKLNNFGKEITLINMGCGGKSGQVKVKNSHKNRLGDMLKDEGGRINIRVTTLRNLVRFYGLNGAILKMDCEGCEYEALLNVDNETLQKFRQMFIKYHKGCTTLVRKLKRAGFNLKILEPLPIKHGIREQGLRGSIFAYR